MLLHFLVARFTCVLLVFAAGCVDPLTGDNTLAPEWHAKNVAGYIETVRGLPPDTAFAWDLSIEGDGARWRECSAIDECGLSERQRPVQDLLGVQHAGQTTMAAGRIVDVVRLSLAPRPKWVLPLAHPVRTPGESDRWP